MSDLQSWKLPIKWLNTTSWAAFEGWKSLKMLSLLLLIVPLAIASSPSEYIIGGSDVANTDRHPWQVCDGVRLGAWRHVARGFGEIVLVGTMKELKTNKGKSGKYKFKIHYIKLTKIKAAE